MKNLPTTHGTTINYTSTTGEQILAAIKATPKVGEAPTTDDILKQLRSNTDSIQQLTEKIHQLLRYLSTPSTPDSKAVYHD